MKVFVNLFLLLFIFVIFQGCSSEDQNGTTRTTKYESPEQCYAAFSETWNAGQIAEAFDTLTIQAQEDLAGTYVGIIKLWQGMGTAEMTNSPFGQALDQVLLDRGITDLDEVFENHLGHDENDDERHVDAMRSTARKLGPPLTFIEDILRLEKELSDSQEFHIKYGELTEVSMDGTRAQGWRRMPELYGELTVDFVYEDDCWLIAQIFPFPVRKPGGNLHRETEADRQWLESLSGPPKP